AIDVLQIAVCPLFVKGEQGRGFERKHGECRHQRIAQGNLHLVDAIVRDGGEVLATQAEERIGTQMFASFWHHDGHSNPQPDIIHVRNRSHEGRIVAFLFTKSQRGCRRGYWDLSTSGNCWSSNGTSARCCRIPFARRPPAAGPVQTVCPWRAAALQAAPAGGGGACGAT